jgi:hypothetical protein
MKKNAIQESNERWLKEKPKCKSQKEKNRINDLLNSKHLRSDEWSGRQYKSVRG